MKSLLFSLALLCGVIASVSSQTPKSGDTTVGKTTTQPTSGNTTVGETIKPTLTPQNTTAAVSPTTGSVEPVTTAPQPTPSTDETKNNYVYFDDDKNNTACLKATFSAHFEKHETLLCNVTSDAQVINETSECGVLDVEFGEKSFKIVFNHTYKGAFYISEVHAILGKKLHPYAVNLTKAKAANGSSYMCTSGITISLSQNITMKMKNVQLQAFYIEDNKFGTALECTGDFPNNMLIPIIVGCALGGLIIVVVIAYCILRARATRNYDPVDNTI